MNRAEDVLRPKCHSDGYEWHDDSGQWFRSCGDEQWELDASGLMRSREVSINDVSVKESDRQFRWPFGLRPKEHPGLGEFDL